MVRFWELYDYMVVYYVLCDYMVVYCELCDYMVVYRLKARESLLERSSIDPFIIFSFPPEHNIGTIS